MEGALEHGFTRRQGLTAAGASLLTVKAWAQATRPITIVVNQSPWFEGFRKTVDLYQQQTGNKVSLDVNPFAGSLEKQRTAVRSGESPFDVLIINAGFFIEMYSGGFLRPLAEIKPGFMLPPEVYSFDGSLYWDASAKRLGGPGAQLMTVPINPAIPLLHYRTDLYEQKGLKVPQTWAELLANAKALHQPPRTYGIVQRGARGTFDVTYDMLPYLWSHGGGIFADQKAGDFTVTINSPQSLAGLTTFLQLAKEAGYPHTESETQADVIQAMATGHAGNVLVGLAAGVLGDANQSAVVGKVGFAPAPHAPGFETYSPLGHWMGGIPRNISDERQRAALTFLDWFQSKGAQIAYARNGSPPVRRDVMESDMSKEPQLRWMAAMAQALPTARLTFIIPEASQVLAITELRLSQAIGGEMTAVHALNTMASEITAVMVAAGYKAPALPALKAG